MTTTYFEQTAGVIRADLDVSEVALSAGAGLTEIEVPAGFVVTGVAVKELEKANAAGTVTLKLGANTIGAAVNIGGGSANSGAYNAGTARVVTENTKVTVALAATGDAPAAWTGKFEVAIVGVCVFRPEVSNTADNKAAVDPMYA